MYILDRTCNPQDDALWEGQGHNFDALLDKKGNVCALTLFHDFLH